MSRNKCTQEEIQEMIRYAKEGNPIRAISALTSRSVCTIRRILNENNVPYEHELRGNQVQKHEYEIIIEMLKQHMPYYKIAKQTGHTKEAISAFDIRSNFPGYERDEAGNLILPITIENAMRDFIQDGWDIRTAARKCHLPIAIALAWDEGLESDEREKEHLRKWFEEHGNWQWVNPNKEPEPEYAEDGTRIVRVGQKGHLRTPTRPDGIWR